MDACKNLHQGRLAGAVFADQCDDFTAANVQMNGLERFDAWERFRNAGDFKDSDHFGPALSQKNG